MHIWERWSDCFFLRDLHDFNGRTESDWNHITNRHTSDRFHNHQTCVVWLWWASEVPKRPLKLSGLSSTDVLKLELKRMIHFNIKVATRKCFLGFPKSIGSMASCRSLERHPQISSYVITWGLGKVLNDTVWVWSGVTLSHDYIFFHIK